VTVIGFIIGGAGAPAYFNSFFSIIGDVTLLKERGTVSGFIGSTAEWGSVIGGSLAAPFLWRSFDIRAPVAFYVIILLAAVLVALMVKSLLRRQTLYVRELETREQNSHE
jgi:MFS family permease